MRRLLLDTSYLLDYAEPGRPDEAAAIELFRQVVSGRYEGVVAASSLKDFYYLACKWQGDQAARDWLRVFMRAFTVVELDIEACAMAVDSDEPDTTHDAALREMGWTILRYDASTVTDGKAQGDEIAAAVKANMRSAKAAAKKKSKK